MIFQFFICQNPNGHVGSGVDVEEEIEEEEPVVKIVCKDQHESCKAWSLKGDCETNAEFMNGEQKRTCIAV